MKPRIFPHVVFYILLYLTGLVDRHRFAISNDSKYLIYGFGSASIAIFNLENQAFQYSFKNVHPTGIPSLASQGRPNSF